MNVDADGLLALASAACAEVAPLPEIPAPGPAFCMSSGPESERTLERARRCAVASPQDPGALRVLEVLGGPEDLDLLARAALVPGAGPTAAEALARLGGEDALEPLLGVACRADGTAAGWAMEALVRFDDPRVDALLIAHVVGPRPWTPAEQRLAEHAARLLGQRGGDAVWSLLDRFPSAFARYALVAAPAGPGVERLLASPPQDVARIAVDERSPHAMAILERLAAHPEPRFRAGAAELVLRLGGDGERAVVAALLDDPDPGVRRATARALATFRQDGRLDDLWSIAVDPADPDRAIAALEVARHRSWADPDEVDRRLLALADRWEAREALYESEAVRGRYASEIGALALADVSRPWLSPGPEIPPHRVQNAVLKGLRATGEGRAALEAIASDPLDPRSRDARRALDPAPTPEAAAPAPAAPLPPPPRRERTADARSVARRARAQGELGLLGVVGEDADVDLLARGLDHPASTRAAVDGLVALGSTDRLEAACADPASRPDLRDEACRAIGGGGPASQPVDAVALDLHGVRRLASHPYGRARLVALEPTLSPPVRAEVRRILFTAEWRGVRPPDAVVRWALDAPADPQAIGFLLRLGEPAPVFAALEAGSVRPVIEALRPMTRPAEAAPAPATPLPETAVRAILGYLDHHLDRGLLEVAVQHPALQAELGRRLLDGAWPELGAAERGSLLARSGAPLDADTAIRLASAEPHEVDWLVGPIADDPERVRAALLELAPSGGLPPSVYRAYLALAPDRQSARIELLARSEPGARYAALSDLIGQHRARRGGSGRQDLPSPPSSELLDAIEGALDDRQVETAAAEALVLLAPDRLLARTAARAPALTLTDLVLLTDLGTDEAAEVAASVLDQREGAMDDVVEDAARWLAERGGPVAERHWDAIQAALAPSYTVVTP